MSKIWCALARELRNHIKSLNIVSWTREAAPNLKYNNLIAKRGLNDDIIAF